MAATRTRPWWLRAATVIVLLLTLAGVLTACGGEDSSTATWVVDPDDKVTGVTTGFTAIVSRVGCGSGVQGKPQTPEIEYTKSEVRITFRISPGINDGTCQFVGGVPYEVKLSEPLGDRSLMDGECHRGSTAWATALCLQEGVRYDAA